LSPKQIFSLALLAVAFAVATWRLMYVCLVTIPVGFALSLAAGVPVAKYRFCLQPTPSLNVPTGIGPAGYGGRRVS